MIDLSFLSNPDVQLYGGLGVTGALLGAAALTRPRFRPRADSYGTARFATRSEIRRAGLFRRQGIVVGYAHGRHLRVARQKHVLLVGPSGLGKSVMIEKTLRTYPESVICLAPKGTLETKTAGIRRHLGPVYRFDPVNGGDHISPWDLIRWGAGEVKDIQRVVSHLTYTEADMRTDAGLFYLSEAQEALWAMIPYLHYSRVAEASMGGLRKFMAVSGQEIRTRLRAMVAFGNPSPHPVVHEWAQQVIDKPMDTLDKIWTAARRWLMPWVDPVLAWNTHDTTIDLQAFQQAETPATLYLNISIEDIQNRLRSFVRLLLDLLSLRLCDRPEHDYRHDVLWVLDDMTELRRLEVVERLKVYLRGYGHQVLGGTQSFAQLWEWYGKYNPVFNNTATWVLFRPNDEQEASVIARKLGEMTVMEPASRVTSSRHGGSRSLGWQAHARDLMTPDELQYDLQADQVLVCMGGIRPMLVSRGPLAA